MGYVSRWSKRPSEYASKSSHSYIIKEQAILDFLKKCNLPKTSDQIELKNEKVYLNKIKDNPIKSIVAIDGGYSEIIAKEEFPSSTITFFQFGALIFNIRDLENLKYKPFIDPEDVAKLKDIERFKFVMPTKNMTIENEDSLINSVRRALFSYFKLEPANSKDKFIDALKWFVYEEYNNPINEWNLASCPNCHEKNIELKYNEMEDYEFKCQKCGGKIYLTDVFRLHEAIDNELGAGGILGYTMTLLEQILLVHIIRLILKIKPNLLKEILFIKDGPLAFFGQTANMHGPMRILVKYLFDNYNLFLAGLEKSGPFVEHAHEISNKLSPNEVLILTNDYIYKYILPGKSEIDRPYGDTTYYGSKVIFKSEDDRMYVVTLPTIEPQVSPQLDDLRNIHIVLNNIAKLKCDMYDDSLVPIALVNKLVSLANHPSSVILEKFVKEQICKN